MVGPDREELVNLGVDMMAVGNAENPNFSPVAEGRYGRSGGEGVGPMKKKAGSLASGNPAVVSAPMCTPSAIKL
jgi:hypothetical protein